MRTATSLMSPLMASLLCAGCLADPSSYPYKGTTPTDVGDADVGSDVGATDTNLADATLAGAGDASGPAADAQDQEPDAGATGWADMGFEVTLADAEMEADLADTAGAMEPTLFDCVDAQASCEPIVCDGPCEVDCTTKNARCVLSCQTTERCKLDCKSNTELCRIDGCDDPTPCGKGWVCNGDC